MRRARSSTGTSCCRRSLAHAGHYPAIDPVQSVSRLTDEIVSPGLAQAGNRLRGALSMLREKEDLISIGAYSSGSDPQLDAALAHRGEIDAFLRQPVSESSDPESSDARLLELIDLARAIGHRTVTRPARCRGGHRRTRRVRARPAGDPAARSDPVAARRGDWTRVLARALKNRVRRSITSGVSPGSPFRFRLERVRALRERQKEMARDQLAQAAERLAGSQGRMRLLDARLEHVMAEQRRIASEVTEISVSELRARQVYAEHIEAQRHAGAGEVARCEADVAVRTGCARRSRAGAADARASQGASGRRAQPRAHARRRNLPR